MIPHFNNVGDGFTQEPSSLDEFSVVAHRSELSAYQDLILKFDQEGILIKSALPTPLGNTGSECQNLDNVVSLTESGRFGMRLHWIQGTFKFLENFAIELFAARLGSIFDVAVALDGGAMTRGLKFRFSAYAVNGILFAWNVPTQDSPGFCWVSIPGSALDSIDINGLVLLFDLLSYQDYVLGWKATRIDFAVDDYHKKITPDLVYEAALNGNFSGYRNKPRFCSKSQKWKAPSYKKTASPWCDSQGEIHQSTTINFGSKQSDKQFYIYDKFAESDGRVDSIRMECRYFDEQANIRYERLLDLLQNATDRQFYAFIGEVLTGSISFVDFNSADRLSRRQLLPFWQEVIDEIGSIKIPVPRKISVLENTIDWCLNQWETSLAIIEQVSGAEDTATFISSMINSGKERLQERHAIVIDKAVNNSFNLLEYVNQMRC